MKAGGRIGDLKLMGLMYLADRECMERYGHPILMDRLVSTRHGPVHAIACDYVRGRRASPLWSEFMELRKRGGIGCARLLDEEEFDALSAADWKVLEHVWDEFGSLSQPKLKHWICGHCREWSDPGSGETPISYERVLESLGHEDVEAMAADIEEERRLDEKWARMHGPHQ